MTEDKDNKFKAKAAAFLATVGSISALIGFGSTLALVKRKDPANFDKGLEETGVSLAIRALGRGTLYAFAGCGCLFYAIWKLSGANNLQEFREKMGSALPRIPKNDPPQSRTEFDGLTDLLKYISEEYGKK
ncbi:transmembrane protein 242 [Schistocerca cancellata]|uniref:transmembrane protein 242 n=1 Tax=Schistocerca cancellata TaxID=274614 RepID=UPI00211869E9|nr:transmembrane protein 242 [Schistocerca cancellata]